MKEFLITILTIAILILIIVLSNKIYKKFFKHKKSQNAAAKKSSNSEPQKISYETKQLMTEYEKYFYKILSENFSDKYLIMPQVNLASVVNKIKDFPKQYQNELYRNIDFGIYDKQTLLPLLLIEINDKTHNQPNRIARDKKVKEICQIAGIKLITFYSSYENKKDYVINRIVNELKKD